MKKLLIACSMIGACALVACADTPSVQGTPKTQELSWFNVTTSLTNGGTLAVLEGSDALCEVVNSKFEIDFALDEITGQDRIFGVDGSAAKALDLLYLSGDAKYAFLCNSSWTGQKGSNILADTLRHTAAIGEIGMGQKDLSDLHVAHLKELLVFGDEAGLSNRRAHLHIGHIGRTRLKSQRLHAGRHGAGRNKQHFKAFRPQFANAVHHAAQRRVIGSTRLLRDGMGTDLDDNAPGILQDRAFFQKIVYFFHR